MNDSFRSSHSGLPLPEIAARIPTHPDSPRLRNVVAKGEESLVQFLAASHFWLAISPVASRSQLPGEMKWS